jgi:hypothetical protein
MTDVFGELIQDQRFLSFVTSVAYETSMQSQRLGLTWSLRQGTVVAAGANTPPQSAPSVSVQLDGDDVNTIVGPIPLNGVPAMGSRVMVLIIPNAMFITHVLGGLVSAQTIDAQMERLINSVVLTTVATDVTELTVNVVGSGRWHATMVADLSISTASTAIAVVDLYVDGTLVAGEIISTSNTSVFRGTMSQHWSGTFTHGGPHTFVPNVRKTAALGVITLVSVHSSLYVETYN